MSGHSKWAQIKRQKGVTDARRSQLFTRLAREITVAARQGDPEPQANARLRLAVQRARDNNMPLENIERAIKRATGLTGASELSELTIEGYGPGGIAVLLQAVTDNRNRTVSEVRNAFSRADSSLGESGCVTWMFEPKGVITVDAGKVDAEGLALIAIDAGADDVRIDGRSVEVYTQPQDMEAVRQALEDKGIAVASAELLHVPRTLIKLRDKAAMQALKLLDRLEELDDVQHVYTNADFPDEVLERYQG